MIYHLSIPQYLLESSFCLIIFYAFYIAFLKKETFFQLNRFYLLFSGFLALVIPLFNVSLAKANFIAESDQLLPILSNVESMQVGIHQIIAKEDNALQISLADCVNWLYLAGVFFMVLKLMSGLFSLFSTIKRAPKIKNDSHTLLFADGVPAASFFSYIFWNYKPGNQDKIQKVIMDHEMVHVKQYHSLDVIAMELMVIVKWFNPLIYLFRNSLRDTHEYIADRYVSAMMDDKKAYANILLNRVEVDKVSTLPNHFYGNVRQRLKMLGSQDSPLSSYLKYLLIFPITIGLFSLFSFDLSERLPDPIVSSLKKVEHTMIKVGQTNILNMTTEGEANTFDFKWGEYIAYTFSHEVKDKAIQIDLTKDEILKIFDQKSTLYKSSDRQFLILDSIVVNSESGSLYGNILAFEKADLRRHILNSLSNNDNIVVGFKSWSETDTSTFKVILNVQEEVSFANVQEEQKIKWGDKEFILNNEFISHEYTNGIYNLVTPHEFYSLFGKDIMIGSGSDFSAFPLDAEISLSFKRADSSGLKSSREKHFKEIDKSSNLKKKNVKVINHYYHGRNYYMHNNYLKMPLKDFYTNIDTYREEFSTITNGDILDVNIYYGEEIFKFSIRYSDGSIAANAPFPIDLPHTSEVFDHFQLVMNKSGKSYVRVDASNPAGMKIVNAYKSSDSYEILDIPGFRSKGRVYEQNLPEGKFGGNFVEDDVIKNLNIFGLNNYYPEEDELIRMDWGKMVSMPNIGNYSIKEFHRSFRITPLLFAGSNELNLIRYDMLLVPESGEIKRFRLEDNGDVWEILNNIDSNHSIYFENMIIEEADELYFYPFRFVFTIEQ